MVFRQRRFQYLPARALTVTAGRAGPGTAVGSGVGRHAAGPTRNDKGAAKRPRESFPGLPCRPKPGQRPSKLARSS